MKWDEIYEYSLKAIENDEMYELLMGEGDYYLPTQGFNTVAGSDVYSIIFLGILKVMQDYRHEKDKQIEEQFVEALNKMMSLGCVGFYNATLILCYLIPKKRGYYYFYFPTMNKLFEMFNDNLYSYIEELKTCTKCGCSQGMLQDIERLERSLPNDQHLFDRRYYILKKLNQALVDSHLILQKKTTTGWEYTTNVDIAEDRLKSIFDNALTDKEKILCKLNGKTIQIIQPIGWWGEEYPSR